MTQLPQPFLCHPNTLEIPESKLADVEEIYKWTRTQPRCKKLSMNYAYLFYHACLEDIPSAKKAITRYVQIRAGAPDLFSNRDIMLSELQFVMDITHMVPMPVKTPEGYNVIIYRLSDTDPSKINFANAIKAFCMFNDVQISEDGLSQGYVIVFDMKGLRLGHLAKLQLGPLRTFMNYIQDAHPVRLKQIYIVHTSFIVNQIMALLKPLIRSELMSLLKFTTLGPSDILPHEVLPVDYGGPLDELEKLHKEQRYFIEKNYREWLIDSGNLTVEDTDEKIKNNCNSMNNIKTAMFGGECQHLDID